ncbi:Tyrosine-protein phosphatase non-receptor type 13, partial [Desmophyllum pertusum]
MLNKPDASSTEVPVDSNDTENKDIPISGNSLEAMDVPPPIPTTPLPSDDDEPPIKPPPRRESLPKFSANNFTGDSYSNPVMNGSISGHGSGSDEEPVTTEPLIDVIEGGQYTGQNLNNLIRSVREKLDSNIHAEEFKTRVKLSGDDDNDYINASHVKIPVGDDIYDYIATQ